MKPLFSIDFHAEKKIKNINCQIDLIIYSVIFVPIQSLRIMCVAAAVFECI